MNRADALGPIVPTKERTRVLWTVHVPNIFSSLVPYVLGCLIYVGMIFFFSYFWNAIQYNVEDISNNLKRAGSIVPGVRPGKQTKDFLDDVISKLTIVGAGFIALIALLQYITPAVTKLSYQYGVGVVGGTSLLILVSVALETMRQIEANLLMKQYDQ